jgi:hypothetical protein
MVVYAVFCKDFEHKKGERVDMLIERRKDMRGQTKWESGTKSARQAFGHLVKDKKDLFVFPKEMEINGGRLLVEKGTFTKEEYLELEKKISQEMKSRAK